MGLLILTHKRGSLLFGWTGQRFSDEFLEECRLATGGGDSLKMPLNPDLPLDSVISSWGLSNGSFKEGLHKMGNSWLAYRENKTAEHLAEDVSQLMEAMISPVEEFFWGVGPGSFTGLRLGSGFLNGYCLGRNTPVFLVSTPLLVGQNSAHTALSSKEDVTRESICRWDLALALYQIYHNRCPTSTLPISPHYGREPTPVLVLRSKTKMEEAKS
jgi:hypothetical protein